MKTVLVPCRVPWAISPSSGSVTLTHRETDVTPECSVVFAAGRLGSNGRTDLRRVELTFSLCYFARTGPHSDSESIEAIGYKIADGYDGPIDERFLDWLTEQWRKTDVCPYSGFYVARESTWLRSLPDYFRKDSSHYVIDGRDGYAELIASGYKWREWLWTARPEDGEGEIGPLVAEGEGVA